MQKTEEAREKLAREEESSGSDFFMGIFLMGFGAVVSYVAWSWPRPQGMTSAPGLFPFFLGVSLVLMSFALFVGAIRKRAHLDLKKHVRDSLASEDTKPTLLALSTILIYMIVLLNLLSFELSTFIYLAGALYIFWKQRLYKILIVAASATALYSFVFKFFFKLMLPGAGM